MRTSAPMFRVVIRFVAQLVDAVSSDAPRHPAQRSDEIALDLRLVLIVVALLGPVALYAAAALRPWAQGIDTQEFRRADGLALMPLILVTFLALALAYRRLLSASIVDARGARVVKMTDTSLGLAALGGPLLATAFVPMLAGGSLLATGAVAVVLAAGEGFGLERTRRLAPARSLRAVDAARESYRLRPAAAGFALVVAVSALAIAAFAVTDPNAQTTLALAAYCVPAVLAAAYIQPFEQLVSDPDVPDRARVQLALAALFVAAPLIASGLGATPGAMLIASLLTAPPLAWLLESTRRLALSSKMRFAA